MKYRFIAQHQQEYPVTTVCQVLEVSVSGYYAWQQRPVSARQRADEQLSVRIRQVHEATHQIYGSRRIRAELAEQGSSCGRKRVVRRVASTRPQGPAPTAPHLHDR
jgi:putative transposase